MDQVQMVVHGPGPWTLVHVLYTSIYVCILWGIINLSFLFL